MKNKNIFVLVCLILFFICCNNNISVDGIYISEHLCELADDRYGADYVGLLETSLNGENDSIRKFVQLSFDAAYAYEHGIIIVGGYATKTTTGWWLWEHDNYYDGHTFIADGYVKYGNNGSKKNDDPYYLHVDYGAGKKKANSAYILSSKKKFIDNAEQYSDGLLFKYKIAYATMTYPSEKNW